MIDDHLCFCVRERERERAMTSVYHLLPPVYLLVSGDECTVCTVRFGADTVVLVHDTHSSQYNYSTDDARVFVRQHQLPAAPADPSSITTIRFFKQSALCSRVSKIVVYCIRTYYVRSVVFC